MTEKKFKKAADIKVQTKNIYKKGTKNLITVTKTVLQCSTLKARKSDVNRLEAKAELQTTAQYIRAIIGSKRCKAKTSKGKQQ